MARNRIIKPDFWADEKIGELTPMARLLFLGTLNFCDDIGVCRGTAGFLRSQIFQFDDLTLKQVDSMIETLNKIGLISVAKINGESFILVKNFLKHQKIDRPSPFRFISGTTKHNILELFHSSSDDVAARYTLDVQYNENVNVNENVDGNGEKHTPRKKRDKYTIIEELKSIDDDFHQVIERMSENQQKKLIEAYTLPVATSYIKKVGGWPKYNTVKDVYRTIANWATSDGVRNQVEWKKQQDAYNKKLEAKEAKSAEA